LNFSEIVLLNSGRTNIAHNIGLLKWVSIVGSTLFTWQSYNRLKEKIHYYNVYYPLPSKLQVEYEKDLIIAKEHYSK
jgi:hypothetical protein